ncbi:unnamed protein product [Rotaria magnacalcarata]|uniref:Uncharacterized protein n=1 Tax=Rotaria magnacalcarata TaxID=392030 RepID=A0A816UQW5_9BILA|nr:unnamed protein product [Rotaria magnacalcarata]CAF4270286.1 unnamed protein product [Rotaria magnacalcarata]
MNIDLNNLSDEVLFYSNEQCLGPDEILLIKLQSIKNARILINVPDVLGVLNIKCKEVVEIKNRICFTDEDSHQFIVKPRIKAGIDDLIEVLKDKNHRYIKRTKDSKSSSLSTKTSYTQLNASVSNAPSLNSTGSTSATTLSITTSPNVMSIKDYVNTIYDSIEKFCANTLKNILLKNDIDYFIPVDGYIKCRCNSRIKMIFRINTNSYQLSSYFKHIKHSRCRMMKKKQEQSNKLPKKIDDLSGDMVQNKDCHNIDNSSVSDQEMLNDENDSFHTINNNYTTKKSYSPQRKRFSSFLSISGTTR